MEHSPVEAKQVADGAHLVSAWGELDLYAAPALKEALRAAVASGAEVVVVDLTAVTFVDSTALGALVAASRQAGDATRMHIACTNPEIVRTFDVTGIDRVLPVYPTVAEAFAAPERPAARDGR